MMMLMEQLKAERRNESVVRRFFHPLPVSLCPGICNGIRRASEELN